MCTLTAALCDQAGGHVTYFGPIGFRGATVRSYFQSLPGVKHMPSRMNPASWVIDIVSGALAEGAPSCVSPPPCAPCVPAV